MQPVDGTEFVVLVTAIDGDENGSMILWGLASIDTYCRLRVNSMPVDSCNLRRTNHPGDAASKSCTVANSLASLDRSTLDRSC